LRISRIVSAEEEPTELSVRTWTTSRFDFNLLAIRAARRTTLAEAGRWSVRP
jgi:hypothetical protein